MLQELRQTFTVPDMHPDYREDVESEELQVDGHDNKKNSEPSCELSQSVTAVTVINAEDHSVNILPEQIALADVIPVVEENLFLKPKNEILFCDYMVYWLESIRKNVAEDTFAGYSYTVKQRIYPYFKNKNFTLADIEEYPFLISDYYSFEMKTYGVSANTIYHRHANIRKALLSVPTLLILSRSLLKTVLKALYTQKMSLKNCLWLLSVIRLNYQSYLPAFMD